MIFKNNIKSFITIIIIGILAGSLCALLDLIPGNNIFTFSSFSGSLGFWALSATIILMQSNTRKLAGINTFLYFAFMNSSFFFVYLLLPIEFPRIQTIDQACIESLKWLIPSFICGIFALITYEAKKDNWKGYIALSLPLGLLLCEGFQLICSVIINHRYLFQTIVDIIGFIIIFFLYKGKKNPIRLLLTSLVVAICIIIFLLIKEGNILYF